MLCNGANGEGENNRAEHSQRKTMTKELFSRTAHHFDASWTVSFPPVDNPSMQVAFR